MVEVPMLKLDEETRGISIRMAQVFPDGPSGHTGRGGAGGAVL
jgi:hypothetical protein